MKTSLRHCVVMVLALGTLLGGHNAQAQALSCPFNFTFGSFGAGDGQFTGPYGVAIDGAGNIVVADANNHRIQVFDSAGTFLFKFGTLGAGDGQFNFPGGVTVDGAGNIVVAEANNHRIQVFDSAGTFLYKFGTLGAGDGQFNFPGGVAVDGAGNIVVAEANNHRIQVFDSAGTFLFKFGSLGPGDGQFSFPRGVAVDGAGNIVVADANNDRIQVFDSAGNFLFKFGSNGAGDGQFTGPYGVAVDGAGNIVVAEANNNRIQVFDSAGTFLYKFGSPGAGDGQFTGPRGVAVDGTGTLVVADQGNHRIQVFACNQNILGNPTGPDPGPTRAEGALWVAGEQAISIVAAAVDAYGCFDFANSLNLNIDTAMVSGATVNPHARADVSLGTAKFAVDEGSYLPGGTSGVQRGLRLFLSHLDPLGVPDADTWTTQGQVGPGGLYQLNGRFNTDETFAVMHGDAHFSWGGDSLDEHIIKDFFLGNPVEPRFEEGNGPPCPYITLAQAQNLAPGPDGIGGLDRARQLFLNGTCQLANAAVTDYNPNNPFTAEPPYIAYDNGLEVTTKKYVALDLLAPTVDVEPTLLFEGSPIGKWRQTSRYRRPNGSNGKLTYTKVRIAPYGVPTCAIELSGAVTGNVSGQSFGGTIKVYNLEQSVPFY